MNTLCDIFIAKAKIVHNDKYNYSSVEYVNSKTKINIVCPIHGNFEQTPNNHIQGSGCISCAFEYDFLGKAKLVHGDRYDYSLTKYRNHNSKITIICRDHGIFIQKPRDHLSGSGCSICGKSQQKLKLTMTHSEFIIKAKAIHNDRYEYCEQYINIFNKITIKCRVHGNFQQLPSNHLRGAGCNLCIIQNRQLNYDDFINKANTIHYNKYTYIESDYIKSTSKTTIVCPKHGNFRQLASDHLSGHGCPMCSESRGEISIRAWLIKNNIEFKAQAKFDSCQYRSSLLFDFAATHNRSLVLIEYHGEQHYSCTKFFGASQKLAAKQFKIIQLRDQIKRQWCLENSTKLLIIPYTDYLIIEDILNKTFINNRI